MSTDEFLNAAKSGDVGAMERLLAADRGLLAAKGSSGETPLMTALYNKREAAADWLVASGAPLDLCAAAALGRMDTLEERLAAPGADVNAYSFDGWTPLHLAAFFGRKAAVERLMAGGADLNAVSRNALRNTPLHAAVAGGHVDVSLLLIAASADVNVADAGRHTPFHIAAEAGYVPVAQALFARGADAHAVDAEDRTPLSRAVAKGHTAIVDLINVVE
jgi:ankyrin repeat protein